MKILVIGSGGREHALVRAFSLSPSISAIHCIPGSSGIAKVAVCHDMDWRDFPTIQKFCVKNEISFVMIGPEDPLVSGLSDYLREHGILVVGPSKEAAQLEGSKLFAKRFMRDAGIPTAFFEEVHSVADVVRVSGRFQPPFVLKADGLAAGKGVFICENLEALKSAASDLFEKQILGGSGVRAVLEEHLSGWELSFLVLTNGQEFAPLPIAQDHKRLRDKDQGPNTGGMGAIAPLHIAPELFQQIVQTIVEPTLRSLRDNQLYYRGILYIGLMITKKGPYVIEYNVRFGDPETQVMLPLLDHDLGQLMWALSKGEVTPLKFKNLSCACVVLAAPGYPDNPQKGVPVQGEIEANSPSAYFIHSGLVKQDLVWKTNGGRVVGAIGIGTSNKEAIANAYQQAHRIQWEGIQFRTDIGASAPKAP